MSDEIRPSGASNLEPSPKELDALFDRLLIGDDPALTAAREATAAAGMPAIEVSPQYGRFLSLLATAVGARRILEIGTLGGYSTIWLARAAGPSGHVTTLEYEPRHAEVARANLDRAGGGRARGGDRRCRPGHTASARRA